jgi:adenylate cyclase
VEDSSFSPSSPVSPDSHHHHHRRRGALAAGLALLWTVFALLAQFSGALDEFEESLLDWRQSLSAWPEPPSTELALVAIDTIPDDRPWPWSRLDYSLVLRALIDYSPQSVVFNMNLNDRDPSYTSFDDIFSHIVDRANIVVFAATGMTPSEGTAPPPRLGTVPYQGNSRRIPRFGSAIWPLETFAGDSPVGVNNMQAEDDLRLRQIPLVFLLGQKMVPALVLQATAQFLGADLSASEVQIGRAIFLRRKDGRLLRTIPIDDEGRMRIRYQAGPITSWQASFDNVMVYDDEIRQGLKPEQDLRELAWRQVWIGRTDPALREQFQTAVGRLSLVEVELQAERTILEQDYVRPLPPMILAMLYLLVGIGGSALIVRLGPLHSTALLIITASFWIESAILAFRIYNVILPIPSFAMLIFGVYIMGLLAIFWDLESEAETHASAPGPSK